jgi:hypothetical protein
MEATMRSRGLYDRNGELFAYVEGDILYTVDGEPTGRIKDKNIVDMGGNPIWRIIGDGVYSMDSMEAVGYFGSEGPEEEG